MALRNPNSLITVAGNLTEDPVLRDASGSKVVNTSIAVTERTFDREANEWKDKEPVFYRISSWRKQAENAAASLKKGDRVLAVLEAKPNNYEKDGVKFSGVQYEVQEIAASLEYATVTITRNAKGSGSSNSGSSSSAPAQSSAPVQSAPAAAEDADFS